MNDFLYTISQIKKDSTTFVTCKKGANSNWCKHQLLLIFVSVVNWNSCVVLARHDAKLLNASGFHQLARITSKGDAAFLLDRPRTFPIHFCAFSYIRTGTPSLGELRKCLQLLDCKSQHVLIVT